MFRSHQNSMIQGTFSDRLARFTCQKYRFLESLTKLSEDICVFFAARTVKTALCMAFVMSKYKKIPETFTSPRTKLT